MATVSSATKFFPTAKEGFATTTSSSVSSAASTVGLSTVNGYNNGEVVALVIDPTDSDKKQVFTGVVDTSGTQITGVVWTEGTDQAHTAGATVVDYETATAWALYSKGILVDHSQAGAHEIATNYDPSNPTLETQKWVGVASAVNELTVTNSATGNPVLLAPTGGDTNINLKATGKGTGGFLFVNPYKFSVYRNAAQSPASGVIQYDTKNFDTGSNVDIVTNKGRFTAPIDGFYQFNVISDQSVTAAPQDPQITLMKNGVTVLGYSHFVNMYNGASSATSSLSVLVQLVATDYVEVYGSALALNVLTGHNIFSGFLESV